MKREPGESWKRPMARFVDIASPSSNASDFRDLLSFDLLMCWFLSIRQSLVRVWVQMGSPGDVYLSNLPVRIERMNRGFFMTAEILALVSFKAVKPTISTF
jgi:hypothetical protein